VAGRKTVPKHEKLAHQSRQKILQRVRAIRQTRRTIPVSCDVTMSDVAYVQALRKKDAEEAVASC
jgi:uncharacterized protein YkwD